MEISKQKSRELENVLQLSGIENLAGKIKRRVLPPLPSTVLLTIEEEREAREQTVSLHGNLRAARNDVAEWDAEIKRIAGELQRLRLRS